MIARKYFLLTILALIFTPVLHAQSGFSPEAYREFRDSRKDYTADDLISDHPARTSYYSSRQFPAELANISWFDTLNTRFKFTSHEKELLEQNFFMVSERLNYMDWAGAFIDVYSNDLPLFLSTDFLLNTLHNSYDAILQTLEWQFLEPNLNALLSALYTQFSVVRAKYQEDSRFQETLKDVDLFLSVALSLAKAEEFLPQYDTRDKFDEVMDAIEAEQMTYMTLFTDTRLRKLDFSQFTPRGHYNKEIYTTDGIRTLEDYFRAMMWLGRIDFLLTAPPENPWEANWTDEELRRMQLGALVLNECLYECGRTDNLGKHEEIISYLVGPDDNMTPGELKSLSEKLLSGPGDLFQSESFRNFREGLNASDDHGQKIMSNFFLVDPNSSDPGNLPVSYKLLGQKFLMDSYVFSEVVFDRIVFEQEKIWRPLPDPLDVMAALGNEDALYLLEDEMKEYKYAANLAGLQYLIEAYDDTFWEQSLYNTWLSALRSLNPPESTNGMPYFMKTTAWHHEKLNTQLTSWAQLRHDNLLYGKQSYTGGTGCSFPHTLIEPIPAFFEQLNLFAEDAADFFSSVLDRNVFESKDRIVAFYQRYGEIMEKLGFIARKELEHIALTDDELIFLKTMINHVMASGPAIDGWYTDLYFDLEKGLSTDYTVADVHTQPTDEFGAVVGNVLHVGNGKINMGVFLAENACNPGHYIAYAGPVSSFHQEVTLNFKRLTDQDWEAYFWTGSESQPSRPDWVATYLADEEGSAYPGGRELKGTIYTGTDIEPGTDLSLFDYLLLFPNPVTTEAHLRFLLNRESRLNLEVFDAAGRLVLRDSGKNILPGEHDVDLPVDGLSKGLYLIRIGLGNQVITREMVVR